ncbi:MAG: DUF5615 family PIN-like protein [Promethearchaeota archaeon]
MKFLLDENVPKKIAQILKELNFDCLTLYELGTLGISNGELAKYAIKHNLIIITCDSDFLTLKKELKTSSKIIYFKVHPRLTNVLVELLKKNIDFCTQNLNTPGIIVISKDNCVIQPKR